MSYLMKQHEWLFFSQIKNSIEQINQNWIKTFHWTNSHNVKNQNKQNCDVIGHECCKNVFNDEIHQTDSQFL